MDDATNGDISEDYIEKEKVDAKSSDITEEALGNTNNIPLICKKDSEMIEKDSFSQDIAVTDSKMTDLKETLNIENVSIEDNLKCDSESINVTNTIEKQDTAKNVVSDSITEINKESLTLKDDSIKCSSESESTNTKDNFVEQYDTIINNAGNFKNGANLEKSTVVLDNTFQKETQSNENISSDIATDLPVKSSENVYPCENCTDDNNSILLSKNVNSPSVDINHKSCNSIEQIDQDSNEYSGGDMHNFGLQETSKPSEADKTNDSSKDSTSSSERQKDSESLVFTEISNEETGFPEVFSGLVTVGKYISVKGDFTLRSSEALVESPSLLAPYLLKEPDNFPTRSTPLKNEQRGFFFTTAGEFLIGIGLGRVSEWYHRDMTRIKKRLIKKDGKNTQLEEDLKRHESFYSESKKANRMFTFPLKTCKTCGFATESALVMEGHLLVPHVTSRREFQCNYCNLVNRDPKNMLEHMYRVHRKTGRIQPPTLFFECPYCTFESNSKVKLSNHLTRCQRFYDPYRNQAPPKDFEFPTLTPKPITVAVVKAYEKSLNSLQRGRGRPKKDFDQMNHLAPMTPSPVTPNSVPSYRPVSSSALSESLSNLSNQMVPPIRMPNMNLTPGLSNMSQLRAGMSPMHLSPSNRFFHVVNSSSPMMPMLGNNSFVTSPSQFPFTSNLVNSTKKTLATMNHSPTFINSLFGAGLRQQNIPKTVPEVTITPLPKLQGPYPVPHVKTSTPPINTSMTGNSLVVCEICDGYIKDLEQLRSHMQLIHKVKIHPKMLVSRPPLNCQKCQWRFFTDQGLERHLLGSHGLVTSNMQELANKGKDAGCCTICGRVYASKLVSHMNQVHKLTLKPAHLSYKCTVCSATFNLYRLFENHVYLVHSGAAKRSADGNPNPSKKLKSSDIDDLHLEGNPTNLLENRTKQDGLAN